LFALAAAALAGMALFLTASREALVGLGVACLVAPFAVGRGRRRGALLLIAIAVVAAVGWFAVLASPTTVARITHPTARGGAGRTTLWKVGWRMFEAHPVGGVGVGNYSVVSINYLLRPGRTVDDRFIVDTPSKFPPHNVYLNVLSELGVVGFVLFVGILAFAVAAALRAARAFAQRAEVTGELLARGLFIALCGYLVALFFSTALYSKQLWLLFASAPPLLALAERDAEEHGEQAPAQQARRSTPQAG
jgi:O-antigen ligase